MEGGRERGLRLSQIQIVSPEQTEWAGCEALALAPPLQTGPTGSWQQ